MKKNILLVMLVLLFSDNRVDAIKPATVHRLTVASSVLSGLGIVAAARTDIDAAYKYILGIGLFSLPFMTYNFAKRHTPYECYLKAHNKVKEIELDEQLGDVKEIIDEHGADEDDTHLISQLRRLTAARANYPLLVVGSLMKAGLFTLDEAASLAQQASKDVDADERVSQDALDHLTAAITQNKSFLTVGYDRLRKSDDYKQEGHRREVGSLQQERDALQVQLDLAELQLFFKK